MSHNAIKTDYKPVYIAIKPYSKGFAITRIEAETDFLTRSEQFRDEADQGNKCWADTCEDGTAYFADPFLPVWQHGEKLKIHSFKVECEVPNCVVYRYHNCDKAGLIEFEAPIDGAKALPLAITLVAFHPTVLDTSGVEDYDSKINAIKEEMVAQKKPEAIALKIATGKVNKELADSVFTLMPMYNDQSTTVAQFIERNGLPPIKTFVLI